MTLETTGVSNNVILVTGDSGSGKSSLLATVADYVYARWKKITRVCTGDGGGYPTVVQARVEAGIIQVWRLDSRYASGGEGLLEETFHKAAQGWWPEPGALDYATGMSLPACRLVAPIATSYKMFCAQGHLLKETSSTAALTPTQCVPCAKMITLQVARVEQTHSTPPGFDEIGAICFEGLSSWSDAQLASLADRRARQELHGEKSSLGRFQSGDMSLDGNNRADYGFAQTQAEKWVRASRAIPGLVIPPVWTGQEGKVEEEGQRGVSWNPAIAGQAKGAKVPQWVGHWIGTQVVVNEAGKREWRLYLSEYRGNDGLPHKYKVRGSGFPEYLSDGPIAAGEDPPYKQFSLGTFLDILEAQTAKTVEKVKAKFPDAPGIKREARVEAPQVPVAQAPPPISSVKIPGVASKPSVSIPGVKAPVAGPAIAPPVRVAIGGGKR